MGPPEVVKILIELGTPCMGEMVDGLSAFSWATAGDFIEIVTTLLRYDRSLINVRDDEGRCPLIIAAGHGHLKLVEKLLDSENIDPTSGASMEEHRYILPSTDLIIQATS